MTEQPRKRIGILVGRELEWPAALITAVAAQESTITADLVQIGGTRTDAGIEFDVIIDRMSHEIPFYRAFLQHQAINGCYIINNPFTWSADNRFVGTVMAQRLGLRTPKTVALPNKEIAGDAPTESFRNLKYPMDWQGIIDYVGVPAIFKDVNSGGRGVAQRVHNVDDLIQQYDESGTRTMILQELIESGIHIHAFVIGQDQVLLLRYTLETDRYLPGFLPQTKAANQSIVHAARQLTAAYGYDINMVEFVQANDLLYVINSTNPAPVIDRTLMTDEQFHQLVTNMAKLAIARTRQHSAQPTFVQFDSIS